MSLVMWVGLGYWCACLTVVVGQPVVVVSTLVIMFHACTYTRSTGRHCLCDVHACATSPVDPGLTNCSTGATVVAAIAASVTCLLGMSAAEYQSKASFAERVGWTGHTQVRAHRDCMVKGRCVSRQCVVPTAGVHREPDGPHNQAPGPVCSPALPHAVHCLPGASTGRREWVGLTQGTSSPPVTTPSAPPTQVYLHVSGSEPACTRCG